jgi:polyferredoxin
MNILHTRRVAQGFFLVLFGWFCLVTTVGEGWYQLRGWPINWFLQLDPLVGLGTLLSTGKIYAGLVWGVLTLGLTVFLGRFFCGWVCPLGALQQFTGWLSRKSLRLSQRRALNQYHPAQALKYYVLFALLAAAALGLVQIGLLDPIPLLQRSINLVVLGLSGGPAAGGSRFCSGVWALALVFLAVLLACVWVPRFYCRFICPLGALFGLVVRWTPWRMGKRQPDCNECGLCDADCEGACDPFGRIRLSECLLCLNCLKPCRQGRMSYGPQRSAAGEVPSPSLSRRGFLASAVTGLASGPILRLGGTLERNWPPGLVRPPGALSEREFLERCIKCGQCMRVCPTNTIQPGLGEAGWEGLWTPVLKFRVGTSGCQLNCIACGNVCPTAAIRPLTLDEKLGRGAFAQAGPLRLGTAFVDRSRCLPWAMDTPCIVCQENCPVSPKAIVLREENGLQKPFVEPARCIGCGICEHECPVSGLRAIRVTAENESRNQGHSLLTKA